jgi:hypothetical protein
MSLGTGYAIATLMDIVFRQTSIPQDAVDSVIAFLSGLG